jgi:gamma-glutamyl:cysteine ligase YbdK (ATP-grasp superfamily)
MGLEITKEHFGEVDYERFSQRLDESLAVLTQLLARPGFGEGPASLGAEIEASLVDRSGRPLPINTEVLARTDDPRLTFELDRFNLEGNLRHGPLVGRPFESLRSEFDGALHEMRRAAGPLGARIALIGILPTLRASDLQSHVMTDSRRYRALSAGLRRLRHGPFRLNIHGDDVLDVECDDVTFEGAATSLQVHLRVAPRRFRRVYNAIQLATPVVLAVSGNSPTFLGRRLWEETRVALFKQAVDGRSEFTLQSPEARVSFGRGWLEEGPLELFRENVKLHTPLLPVLDEERPSEALAAGAIPTLRELRLHQGTVWRWNRAIYDPADEGHLRVEMRFLPAGPTIEDMLANVAFLIGLALAMAPEADETAARLPFEALHHGFYRAGQSGLDAELPWPCDGSRSARDLALRLLPKAQAGLDSAGVDPEDSVPLLEIIRERVESGRTGARWQRRTLERLEANASREEALTAMFARYLAHSEEALPVHRWPCGDEA